MPENEIFFAFPDGVLDYDCHDCKGLCCRDHGIFDNIHKGLSPFLSSYPEFANAACGMDGTRLHFSNPEQCFFLDDDNLCRIEKEHGKNSKPDACRYFPFSSIARCGETAVVSPKTLCPLQLTMPARPDVVAGSHERLRREMKNTQLLKTKNIIDRFYVTENADIFLENEKSFLDTCSKRIGTHRFGNTLLEHLGDNEPLTDFLSRVKRIMGINSPESSKSTDEIDLILHALAPTIRLSMSWLSSNGRIRALAIHEMILRRLSKLQPNKISLKRSHRIYQDLGPAFRLLASFSDPLPVPPHHEGKTVLPPNLTYGPMVLAAQAAVMLGRAGKTTIEALEIALDADLHPSLRSAFLVEFGIWIETVRRKAEKPSASAKD